MLEVRNLSKIYKQKNGVSTHALDDVSLRFPEKGMVFLLGKSGSGKSTLLNACGGLDAPTSGEIIVKGRSSKDFSQSDFDSYRNTFVGFIFQEYNILNEFTVEDNIALALELQGKPKDKKAIADLLEQVDLTGYAKRKPNTLSGGQKQRIAIARALVKSPEIIMADEPTGALDSATGKQVFDTLKKLSEDKLVMVVSHDREFAELYADRIIELKDGKVLSDVTKTQEKQEAISKNVTQIGDVLCVKQGSDLTDDDFEQIKKIIKKSSGDIIIAGGEKDVANFKKVNRITDKGEKEVFKDTDESKAEIKKYTPEQSRFIRSKLPARHAAKIGISGLKTKPVRLFFTILLCVVSFVLFGTLSTLMLYNSEGMFKQTLKDSDHDFVVFDKIYTSESSWYENGVLQHSYTQYSTAKFSSAEIKEISKTFGSGAFGAISVNAQVPVRQANVSYWKTYFTDAAYMSKDAFLRKGLIGTYPQNDNEICISSYFANMLKECETIDQSGATIELNSYTDIIGKTISVSNYPYVVTGIFDSGEIDSKFDTLKESSVLDYALMSEFESMLNDNGHLLVALSENGLKEFSKRNSYSYYGDDSQHLGYLYVPNENDLKDEGMNMNYGFSAYYTPFSKLNGTDFIGIKGDVKALKDNEAIVSFELISDVFTNKLYSEQSEIQNIIWTLETVSSNANYYNTEINNCKANLNAIKEEISSIEREMRFHEEGSEEYNNLFWRLDDLRNQKEQQEASISEYSAYINDAFLSIPTELGITPENIEEEISKRYARLDVLSEIDTKINIVRTGRYTTYPDGGDPIVEEYSAEERGKYLREVIEALPEATQDLKVNFYISSSMTMTPITEEKPFSVVGIIIPTGTMDFGYDSEIYFNDKTAAEYWEIHKKNTSYSESTTKYKDEEGAIFTKLYVPYDHSDAQTNYLWNLYSAEDYADDDSKISLVGTYISSLQMIDSFVATLSTVFFYIGLVLAIFAILLFSNFISVSISQKRREIGILRAVGARSLDVFKIFFSESLTIAAICSAISIAGSSILCQVLNTEVGAALGASIFVFGITSVIIIIAIAVLTAALATFVPVWNAAKKKPVDSIRAI